MRRSDIPDWPRPQYRPGGGDALLYYMVFGRPPESFALDGKAYRVAGIPRGMALDEYDRETQPAPFEVMDQPVFAEGLSGLGRDVAIETRQSSGCLLLHGTVPDPPDLNYLRDSVGLVQFLLDKGAVSILDVQTARWYTPDSWRSRFFDPGEAAPRCHVFILGSEDEENPGRMWYHTRGMRKFGRPDLSIRNVSSEREPMALEVCNRFIEHLAFGMIVEEGEELRMAGLPGGIVVRHAGDLDDPDFNNTHLAVRFPDV